MDGWMDGWMDGRMGGWMEGWMDDGWMEGWIEDGWMDGWLHEWCTGWFCVSTWHKLELSQRKEPPLRKCHHEIQL